MTTPVKQSLNGAWQFRQTGGAAPDHYDWVDGTVPGGAHTDLLNAGLIPDPFVGDNERKVQWVAEQDWEYRRTFTLAEGLREHERIFLVCDGLDTLAEVYVNGHDAGHAENMFRQYRWEVKEALRTGENEIRMLFRSPVRYATEENKRRPMPDVNNPLSGAPYLRKVPSHFGWDWGPQIPATGIWRDIRLEGYSIGRISNVVLRQRHTGGRVTISAAVETDTYSQSATPVRVTLRLTAPDGRVQTAEATFSGDTSDLEIEVEEPQLWWPNDYGSQPLYHADVELANDEGLLDDRTYTLGLRTIALRQEPDDWGKSFTFVVNGVPIFAKGSNWIPADSFITRVSDEQLEDLLGSAAEAHHNMVRVWGGGFYESEAFYDLCDRLGLLVWQDFIFACAGYPLDDEAFLRNVHEEVKDNVRRLRHRASLALWCGNNEIETAWDSWGWNKPENTALMAAYERFFDHILPGWVRAEDPDRSYWPSSPSSGGGFNDPNGNRAGDVHQWAVWHRNLPFSNYRETPARFVSEFGFESIPAMPTVTAFAQPADWNITSYIMEYHQRSPVGNEKIVVYLLDNFRMPKDFPSLVYISQLLQAEAMRTGVEHWRRHPACSGALYWQLNDCWPVISWSGIDYFGRWKALHYSSRRFYSPLLLSIEDEGTRMSLFVTNDQAEVWKGEVRWSLETLRGEPLDGGAEEVTAAPYTTASVKSLDFSGRVNDDNRRDLVLVCELQQNGEHMQRAIATFAPTKHLQLDDPQITVSMEQVGSEVAIELQASSLARFVELAFGETDARFSDNYFDLPAGRSVRVTCTLPEKWTLEETRRALRVRSVFDSY